MVPRACFNTDSLFVEHGVPVPPMGPSVVSQFLNAFPMLMLCVGFICFLQSCQLFFLSEHLSSKGTLIVGEHLADVFLCVPLDVGVSTTCSVRRVRDLIF